MHLCHNRYCNSNSCRQYGHVSGWACFGRIRCRVSLEIKCERTPALIEGFRGLVATVPIYLSEISSPRHRGLIGGISGCGISFGTMMSNWVGFACGYAPYGATQWRLPLALQIPWGIVLFAGLSTFMPNSPRQLIRNGKVDQARVEYLRIHRDLQSHEAQEEFALMHGQIEYEMQREFTSYKEIFKLFRHRALV